MVKAPHFGTPIAEYMLMNLDFGLLQFFILMTMGAIFKNGHQWLLALNALAT